MGCAPKPVLLYAHQEISPLLRRDPFKVLPFEICLRILSHIKSPKTLVAASQVSKLWYIIVSDDSTWRKLCLDHHLRRRSAAESYIHKWKLHMKTAELIQAHSQNSMCIDYADDSNEQIQPTDPVVRGESLLGSRSDLLISTTEQSFPVIRYGFRMSSQDQANQNYDDIRSIMNNDDTRDAAIMARNVSNCILNDPISEAYYNPHAFTHIQPHSYRAHFQQQYLIRQAWVNGGTLAARYSLQNQSNTTVTTVLMKDGYIAVALDTSLILIFSENGMLIRSLFGHVMGVWSLAISGNTLVSGGCDRDVREWDLLTGACRKILRGHQATIRCLCMPDEKTAISGGRDAVIQVWDLEDGSSVHKLLGHVGPVRRLEVVKTKVFDSNDLERSILVSASYDGTAKVWDLESGAMIYSFEGHCSQIYSLACTTSRVITGSLDSTIQVWDLRTGQRESVLVGHGSLVSHLAISGNKLISGGANGLLRIWDLDTMESLHRIVAHDDAITSMVLNEELIVAAGGDCAVNIWDIRTGTLVRQLAKPSVSCVWGVDTNEDRLF